MVFPEDHPARLTISWMMSLRSGVSLVVPLDGVKVASQSTTAVVWVLVLQVESGLATKSPVLSSSTPISRKWRVVGLNGEELSVKVIFAEVITAPWGIVTDLKSMDEFLTPPYHSDPLCHSSKTPI